MIYWHIQMNQPWGRDNGKIDSIIMLQEEKPVIGTGEWDNFQCKYFKDGYNGLKINDIILVKEGAKILALCKVIGDSFQDKLLEQMYHHRNFRYVEVLDFYEGKEKFPQPQGSLQRLINKETDSWNLIDQYYQIIRSQETSQSGM